jgi:hypothetical protein
VILPSFHSEPVLSKAKEPPSVPQDDSPRVFSSPLGEQNEVLKQFLANRNVKSALSDSAITSYVRTFLELYAQVLHTNLGLINFKVNSPSPFVISN